MIAVHVEEKSPGPKPQAKPTRGAQGGDAPVFAGGGRKHLRRLLLLGGRGGLNAQDAWRQVPSCDCRLHPISDRRRQFERPLRYGGAADADGFGRGCNRTTEETYCVGLLHDPYVSTLTMSPQARLLVSMVNYRPMLQLKERIEELMRAKGWSVAQIARAAGVSSSSVSQWLGKGSKEIKSIALGPALKLEAESGFSALWLSKGEGPKQAPPLPGGEPLAPPPNFADRRAINDSDWQLLSDIKDLPEDEQHSIISDLHSRAERYRAYGRELLAKLRGAAEPSDRRQTIERRTSAAPVSIERRREPRRHGDAMLGGISAFGSLDERGDAALRKTAEERRLAKKRAGS